MRFRMRRAPGWIRGPACDDTLMMRVRPVSRVLGALILGALVLVAAAAPWLAPVDPFGITAAALEEPSRRHPFGTDDLGRDLFAAVVHGAATSLQVGLVGAAAAALAGIAIGGAAGLRGGAVDETLMRTTEFVQAMPRFFLVVTIVSLFGSQQWLIVGIIGCTAWPATARVFRAQVISTTGREFVLASRAAGCGDAAVLYRHVLPLTASVLAAHASYQAGGAILAEAGLSFLGLGDPTVMSWGTLLGSAQHLAREAWWMPLFPGIAVSLSVLACNLLADSLVHHEDHSSA